MAQIWAFDCEWAPDLEAGRRLFNLSNEVPDDEVMRVMWQEGGATDENPQPFLKTVQCRVCSIAAVVRDENGQLFLWTVPSLEDGASVSVDNPYVSEADILRTFLGKYERNLAVRGRTPSLVGYNSRSADIHILLQRALINGLQLRGFFEEATAKPWNQTSVDLMDFVGGKGKGYNCSLNEIAVLCGIPGKLDTHGEDVAGLYYGNKRRKIVEYNVYDALTTYLLWLRIEYFRGAFSFEEYQKEQDKVRKLICDEMDKPHGAFLKIYMAKWDELSAAIVNN